MPVAGLLPDGCAGPGWCAGQYTCLEKILAGCGAYVAGMKLHLQFPDTLFQGVTFLLDDFQFGQDLSGRFLFNRAVHVVAGRTAGTHGFD